MKHIMKYTVMMDEELASAKDYAEQYLMCKAKSNSLWANRYREMAEDELKHAMYIHEKAVADIQELQTVYTAPVEMQEEWDKSHKVYVEKTAWIKQMLTM